MSIINKGVFGLNSVYSREVGNDWPTAQVIYTNNIVEVSSNLYFTNNRARDALINSNVFVGNVVAQGGFYGNALVIRNINVQDSALTASIDTTSLNANTLTANAISSNLWLNLYTANVVESSSNLYFTNTRVVNALIAGQNITIESNGRISSTSVAETVTITNSNTFVIQDGVFAYNVGRDIPSAIRIFVINEGLVQIANVDYTVANSNVIFTTLPVVGSNVEVRFIGTTASNLISRDNLTTTEVAEGANLYYTNARARTAVSGGDGISYNPVTGVITAAVVSTYGDSNARLAFSGGTGVSYDNTTGVISIGQNVFPNASVSFGNLIVTGNLSILGNAAIFETNTLAITDPLIQVGKNPVGDVVDLGFFGHYMDGAVERHAGLFRDASDGQFRLFTNLDPEPLTVVDTANATYQNANLIVNFVVGKVTDISNHSTTNLQEGSNLYFTNTRAVGALIAGSSVIIEANGRISVDNVATANVAQGIAANAAANTIYDTYPHPFLFFTG